MKFLNNPCLCSNISTLRAEGVVMSITISSRKFNQDTSGAKKATKQGPVFITDRGHTAHVLLSFDDYEKLAGGLSLLDAIAQTGDADFDFEPSKLTGTMHKPADLS
jgi:PHD/YefM family antitoxin component YafN of YafNO toxin-antitoxin module